MPRQLVGVGEAARRLGISLDTLRRWDRAGRIRTERDAANRRLVPVEEIERLRAGAGAGALSAAPARSQWALPHSPNTISPPTSATVSPRLPRPQNKRPISPPWFPQAKPTTKYC